MLKVGFSRRDITPQLGEPLMGYFEPRTAKGMLDPLLATAVVFDDGQNRAAIMSVDVVGITQAYMATLRPAVAKAIGADPSAVFIAGTHTHLGPDFSKGVEKYSETSYQHWVLKQLCDVAVLAAQDLSPATKFLVTRGKVHDVAFVRRFRMKDGSVRTNPGYQNPDIDHSLGSPDEESQLLIIKRENKPEIGIVNFQVHPDVIGGEFISADFPKFVRDTYELNVPNSLCMYINGAQGDTNHIDVRLDPKVDCASGYSRSRYMGRKIAMSVISNYELAEEINFDGINYDCKFVTVKYNKGSPEEIPEALELAKRYHELGSEGALPDVHGMARTEMIAKATRIERMQSMPDNKELLISVVSVGDVVFAGFPGEPFTDMGRAVKERSQFKLTIPACCANGYEGYFPMQKAFDEGGYEVLTARYVEGTAEKLVEQSVGIMDSFKQNH